MKSWHRSEAKWIVRVVGSIGLALTLYDWQHVVGWIMVAYAGATHVLARLADVVDGLEAHVLDRIAESEARIDRQTRELHDRIDAIERT